MRYILIVILLTLAGYDSFSQKENALLRQGNRKFENGEYKEAEKDYRKALELNKESVKGQFNLGAAVYKNNNFEEATKIYNNLAEKNTDREVQSKVFHNLGNSYLQSKEYEKSILAYKNALMNNPKNVDTKYNLEYAKMMLKKQQQQQQQNKDNKDKKDDKKDQKDKKDEKQDQKQKNDQQKQPQDQKKISKDDAERMLEALKNDEKKTMQKVKKQKAKVQVIGIEKDW
ncbi:MAG: tetratricopeptide repeat protein [Bacteroidetes bacterium]|nr:tetratricopeptide repeat protein [Bacteroidota bacterium]